MCNSLRKPLITQFSQSRVGSSKKTKPLEILNFNTQKQSIYSSSDEENLVIASDLKNNEGLQAEPSILADNILEENRVFNLENDIFKKINQIHEESQRKKEEYIQLSQEKPRNIKRKSAYLEDTCSSESEREEILTSTKRFKEDIEDSSYHERNEDSQDKRSRHERKKKHYSSTCLREVDAVEERKQKHQNSKRDSRDEKGGKKEHNKYAHTPHSERGKEKELDKEKDSHKQRQTKKKYHKISNEDRHETNEKIEKKKSGKNDNKQAVLDENRKEITTRSQTLKMKERAHEKDKDCRKSSREKSRNRNIKSQRA